MKHKMASFKVKSENVEQAKKAIEEFVEAVRIKEPGTSLYESWQLADGVSFIHLMTFQNEEAEKIHQSSEYVKKFTDVLYPLCEKTPEFTDLTKIATTQE